MTTGRTALVTGGTRGIGAAIASRFVLDGHRVIVTGTSSASQPPKGCDYRAVDFSDRGATEAFADAVKALNIDILVNNAGTNTISPFARINSDDFDRIQLVNVRAPLLLCQAVLPAMQKNKWGRIVNVSSIFGKVSKTFRGSYSASKFSLDGLTAALAAEVAVDGIMANCVAPGFIDTDLTRAVLGEAGIAEIAKQVPIGRLGTPDEVAALVSWLASAENSYLSGQNIAIDGGYTRV